MWKQDYNPDTKVDAYRSEKIHGKAAQTCTAYRVISENQKMSPEFKWGHNYSIMNGVHVTKWGHLYDN